MRSELVIITPELACGSGGLADHTLALLEHWGALPDVTLLVAKPTGAVPPASANVQQLGTSQHDILKQLPPESGTIFLQYSAYGFDQFGYPRNLIKALIDWKTQTRGRAR